MDHVKMMAAARETMRKTMDLTATDRVLVITDIHTESVGRAFALAAEDVGCSTDTYFLPEDERPLTAIPIEMIERANGKTVVLNIFRGSGEETPFRIDWVNHVVTSKTVRLGHSPGITEEMMLEGPMNVDYDEMMRNAKGLMSAFDNARSVHITAPAGTDIVLGIEDRGFQTDVHITEENPGNLPCGEIWCGPEETRANGKIVIDGSIGDVGNVSAPLTMHVKAGRLERLECEDAGFKQRIEELTRVDAEASVIGELGIGLNPGAKLSGNLLEDEKALNTAHIAFGNNEDMPGGKNQSKTHRDFLFYNPTFDVTFKDGSTRMLIQDGKFVY